MKIAITGGAGFIGSRLARAYLDAGHIVIVIDNLANGSRQAVDPRARFYCVDIRDRKLQTILQQERPDIVSHHVVQRTTSVWDAPPLVDADMHIRGLLNVLDGCVNASVSKFIFASGGNALYGKVDPEQYLVKECAPLCPQRPCDICKVAGEWYVRYYTRHYGLTHTILRYADVYGETDSMLGQHPLTYFTTMLLENRRPVIRGTATERHDHIFIDDVVRANVCTLKRGKNQTLHISSGQGYDIMQFYCAVAQLLSSDLLPLQMSDSYAEPVSVVLDNTLARQVLGWRPEINFAEGVRRAVELLRSSLDQQEVVQQVPAKLQHAGLSHASTLVAAAALV